MERSTSANDIVSVFLKTGTTNPPGLATATLTSQYSRYTISFVSSSMYAFTAGNSCSAAVEAFTKALMKPNFTPCFSKNDSLYFLRVSIKLLISTSWNVVNIAAVFWASLRRAATRWRIRDILVRRSVRCPRKAVAVAANGTAGAGGGVAGAVGGGVGGAAAATGGAGAAAAGAAAAGATTSGVGAEVGASEGTASESMRYNGLPTSTTSSISPIISTMAPASVARISTDTLSVSTTTTTSSACT
mmetsp:Transcript_29736/g.45496  ORF Transcript_29736/g.45496 Transcript_29736/m.45496 type:complete len:245 (-) Transcript_29736:354-1088(-)